MPSVQLLDHILKRAEQKKSAFCAIFDLDSTLFSVAPRTQHILHQIAHSPPVKQKYPEESSLLSQTQATEKDWGIKAILLRSGIRSGLDFFELVREHWVSAFFSSHHLHLDQPYPGAVDFVRELYWHGAQIRYLTGRDVERMGHGSYASLNQWGFPLERQEHLVMKPRKEMDDHSFKTSWLSELKEQFGDIWFFENEPVIINQVINTCPNINVVFMDSVHSGREEVPAHVPRLNMNFNFTRK